MASTEKLVKSEGGVGKRRDEGGVVAEGKRRRSRTKDKKGSRG